MKILLIVIDGLGDNPIPRLNNKTPLDAARTPNLDWLAQNGLCGIVKPFIFNWEKVPQSETCHLAIFGYDPQKYFLGRGTYEALGIGVDLKEGDIAFRVNFATLGGSMKIIDRRAGRISETGQLVEALSGIIIEDVEFLFKESWGHRAVLILRGQGISTNISSNDIKVEGGKEAKLIIPKDKTEEAIFTAKILNIFIEKTRRILEKHPLNIERKEKGLLPANFLLIRGPGQYRNIIDFYQKYKLKACCVAGGALYKGIAKSLGMDLIKVEGANGSSLTNLMGKFLAIKTNLEKYDFVFCHIKAPDNLAEAGDFFGKKEFIEKIDENIKLISDLKNTLIVITADHSTCSDLKDHCFAAIPILFYRGKINKNKIGKFSEKNCQEGVLGIIKQMDIMKKIVSIAKK